MLCWISFCCFPSFLFPSKFPHMFKTSGEKMKLYIYQKNKNLLTLLQHQLSSYQKPDSQRTNGKNHTQCVLYFSTKSGHLLAKNLSVMLSCCFFTVIGYVKKKKKTRKRDGEKGEEGEKRTP